MTRLLTMSLILLGCGGDTLPTAPTPWEMEEIATCTPGSCPSGLRCIADPVCGATPRCQENLCSAAAPNVVCGCDGRITTAAAGCPGPLAWFGSDLPFGPSYDDVERACDPGLSSPYVIGLEIEILKMEAWEGAGVLLKFREDRIHNRLGSVAGRVEGGVARVQTQVSHDTGYVYGFLALIDLDADGACSPGDIGMQAYFRDASWGDWEQLDLTLVLEAGDLEPLVCDVW